MQSSSLWLFFLLVLLTYSTNASSSPRTLKLCLYLKAIKRRLSECDDVIMGNATNVEEGASTNSTLSPLAKIIANIEKRNEKMKMMKNWKKLNSPLPICVSNVENGYKQCRMDVTCPSGYSCESGSETRCCMQTNYSPQNEEKTEEFKKCPPRHQMAYFCQASHARNAVNTCRTDRDCMFTNVQKCCDAGCDFNVCVAVSGNFTKNALIFLGSKQ